MSIRVSSHTHCCTVKPHQCQQVAHAAETKVVYINNSHCPLWHLCTFLSLTKTSRVMFMMFKTALVYTFLLCGVALHGSCTSTCSCGDSCTNDQAAMPCLYHADFPTLTAGRGIKWVQISHAWMNATHSTEMQQSYVFYPCTTLQWGSLFQLQCLSWDWRSVLRLCWDTWTHYRYLPN